MDNTEITKRIKAICKERKVSQKALLENCGINRNFFYDLEHNQNKPSIEKIVSISNYLCISSDYLLCRTDDRNPKEAPPVDEAKEANSALVELARNCPEEKADLMLRLMQTVLQDEKKE